MRMMLLAYTMAVTLLTVLIILMAPGAAILKGLAVLIGQMAVIGWCCHCAFYDDAERRKTMKAYAGMLLSAILGIVAWLALISLLWALVGCGGQGGDATLTHQEVFMETTEAPQSLSFPVAFTIVERTDGSGNAMWTRQYARALLAEASRLVDYAVTFELVDVHTVENDYEYRQTQLELLSMYTGHGAPGMVNVIISRPDTEDSAGRSRPWRAHTPLFVMRARPGDTITDTALIFLHELGHNLGLAHESNPFYGDGLTTDNYHMEDTGRQLLRIYRNSVIGDYPSQ